MHWYNIARPDINNITSDAGIERLSEEKNEYFANYYQMCHKYGDNTCY